jgi:glutamyl-Q tRNA(Asp) synthetase
MRAADMKAYVGRFAPSPTGPLHAGSIVAALASWLDARAHGGRWRVRIEDVDVPRCVAGAAEIILGQLAALGLLPDGEVLWQSSRGPAYAAALERLRVAGKAYACSCTRADIAAANARAGRPRRRDGELVYSGTCRALPTQVGRPLAHRLLTAGAEVVRWVDRRLGAQAQDVEAEVGDFVLKRADGCWAYQLAVVVDDAEQGITDIVRGDDLADNTARQILLQRCLGLPTPRYLHTPLVLGADGRKLSKQNGAAAVDTGDAIGVLRAAGTVLGLSIEAGSGNEWRAGAIAAWRRLVAER